MDEMNTAREKVREELLLDALVDPVHLDDIHSYVTQRNPSAELRAVQNETLETIRSLVDDGLFELGDVSGEGGDFVVWPEPLDVSMQKIADLYITHHDDKAGWIWCCWLNLTDKGEQAAQSTDEGRQVARSLEERGKASE